MADKVVKSEDEWRKNLTPEQYEALPESIIVRELRRRVYRTELESWVEYT